MPPKKKSKVEKVDNIQEEAKENKTEPAVNYGFGRSSNLMTQDEIDALKRPFPRERLSFRAMRHSGDGTSAMAAAYIDARDVFERLDEVFPGNWDLYTHVAPVHSDGKPVHVIAQAQITIMGQIRSGHGEAAIYINDNGVPSTEAFKSAESDAIKRAAVTFGIGQYLYALPMLWLPWEGTKASGKFTVNPYDEIFDADGNIRPEAIAKDTKGGRKGGGETTESDSKPKPKSSSSKPKPKPKTSTSKPKGASDSNIPTTGQITWLENLYEDAGEEMPDFSQWTREEVTKEIMECIEGVSENHITLAQLKVVVDVSEKQDIPIPHDIAEWSKSESIAKVGELIKGAKG